MNERNKLPERANASGCEFAAEEIAAALKTCARSDASACRSCPIGLKEVDGRCCFDALRLMAAELIEAQTKRIKELEELVEDRTKDVLFYAEREKWIPVTERLPEADDGPVLITEDCTAVLVLVMIEGAKTATTLYCDVDNHDFFDMQGDELIPYRVTHWRPMPKRTEAGHE